MTRRLLTALVALNFLTLAALVIPLGISNQRSEQARLTRLVERDALAAAALSAGDAYRNPPRASRSVTEHLQRYTKQTGARVVVVDSAGSALTDTGTGNAGRSFATRPEIRQALGGQTASGTRFSETLGYNLLYVAVPMTRDGSIVGAVRISYPLEEVSERIARYWLVLLAISCVVLAGGLLVALLLARWVVGPLSELTIAAKAMGDGDLSLRARSDVGPPEIRALAEELNRSVAIIEAMVHDQSRFIADAAHQLRTPLQAMRLRLENLERALERSDVSKSTRHQLTASVDEVDRLAMLVTALLVLARADDASAADGPQQAVDISALISERHSFWSELAEPHDVSVEILVPDSSHVGAWCTPIHLEQSLDNLVDNAISVTPAGGKVEIIARATAEATEIHVVDRGPGMTDEQRAAAFTRFSTTRPSTGGAGGFGLGLAIVQRLVEADGGSVELNADVRGGIDAVIRLPRSSRADAT